MIESLTSIFEFFGKFIVWLGDKDMVKYFPPFAFFAAFIFSFLLTLIDKEAFRKKDAPAKYKFFLNDPLTWFYKLIMIPVSSFIFADFMKNFPSANVFLYNLGIIVLAATALAIIITLYTMKRFILVKKRKIEKKELNEKLRVTQNWHDYWWAWKPGRFQLAAIYNNFIIYPLMFFFSGITLGMVFYLPFYVMAHNGSVGEAVRNAIQSGNIFVVLVGLGMTFNLIYYKNIYSDLYNSRIIWLYIVIYIICAFFGLYALYLVSLKEVMKVVSNLFIHGLTISSIFFNEKIKKIFSLKLKK